jgi:glucose/arabinose dehydrogenase
MNRNLLLAACCAATTLSAQPPVTVQLSQVASGLTRITDIAHCGDERLFCALQAGTIRIVGAGGSLLSTPFLNIAGQVNSSGNEQGLLGLAFDPNYADNGRFYVFYTFGSGAGTSRVSRFTVGADPNVADAASEEVLLTIPQPFTNHNGGDLEFGPDGMLYISVGDGGSGGDPQNLAQNLGNLNGSILRIDVTGASGYTIPEDNPFLDTPGALPEIWAYGLRNPWRIGFDRTTGDLWIGDVGQNAWEEVDFWPAGDHSGPNFGWRCYEGFASYTTSGCQPAAAYVPPVQVHPTGSSQWCSVIGGRVYRGTEFPRLSGRYIYTDYCKGEFHSLRPNGQGGWVNEVVLAPGSAGFSVIAENAAGELFAGRSSNGTLHRIIDPCPLAVTPSITQEGDTLTASGDALSYTWSVNGTVIPGESGPVLIATTSGSYTVTGNFGPTCSYASDPVWVSLVGVEETAGRALRIYPVPTRDVLQVEGLPADTRIVRLLDSGGREVVSSSVQAIRGPLTLDLRDLASGTYLLEAVVGGDVPPIRQSVAVLR